MSYDPAIPLLDINPEKTIIQKHTRTPMFTAALFTTARPRSQSNCPTHFFNNPFSLKPSTILEFPIQSLNYEKCFR